MKREYTISLIVLGIIAGLVWLNYTYRSKKSLECSKKEEISSVEDLMREHGVLNRLLLIYEEVIRRIEQEVPVPLGELKEALLLMQSFIENYHEKLEENYIFPIFEAQKKELDLVKTLRKQHQIGREITTSLLRIVSQGSEAQSKAGEIQKLLKEFIAMYRPHAAREDTELFPKLSSLICKKQLDQLSEKFEELEQSLFGAEGFFKEVNKVTLIEQKLHIHTLNRF